MKKAIQAIGIKKLILYIIGQFWASVLAMRLVYPPLRTLVLRFLGSEIGKESILHPCSFFNIYRMGFKGFRVGDECFVGDECLFDLADSITLESEVTLAERVVIITHTNVGYASHPLQTSILTTQKPVKIKSGAFIGTSSTILPGVTIGSCSIVAAGSLVNSDVPDNTMVAGVPAKVIKSLYAETSS